MTLSVIICISCNKAVQQGIYNSAFYPNLVMMLSAFIALGIVISVFWFLALSSYKTALAGNAERLNPLPLISAGAVLGMGLGGFIDGIALHQILQWHEMLTARIPADTLVNKSVNMFWDGIFHAFTLLTTLLGVFLMFKVMQRQRANKSGLLLLGGLIGGWGLFNMVEGLINHHILRLHNVYEYTIHRDIYNYGFLLSGVFMFLLGWILSKKSF